MKSLYICHSIYHVYILLIKEIDSKKEISVILCNSIVNYENIAKNIKEKNLFKNVFLLDESSVVFDNNKKGIYKILEYRNLRENKVLNFNFHKYNNIYVFNDWTKIGIYLILNKIEYNLIEDGLNCFKNIDKIGYHKYNFMYKTLNKLNLIPLFWGQSNICKSIEVNEIKGIVIPLNKVKELDRKEIMDKLSKNSKKTILDIFLYKDNLLKMQEKSILILTQPLFKDKLVLSEKDQINIYESIIRNYCNEYKNIIIKPHPRDEIEYYFKDCIIVDKSIPIEILNFNENIKIDKAITVFSTAIDGIDFVKEKISLGFDYIKKINN